MLKFVCYESRVLRALKSVEQNVNTAASGALRSYLLIKLQYPRTLMFGSRCARICEGVASNGGILYPSFARRLFFFDWSCRPLLSEFARRIRKCIFSRAVEEKAKILRIRGVRCHKNTCSALLRPAARCNAQKKGINRGESTPIVCTMQACAHA